MRKYYFVYLYFILFVPMAFFYKLFKKPIFINEQNKNEDNKVYLMLNETKKNKLSVFVRLIEKIV